MDFKKLRTFDCAAQTLSFSAASDRLGYVQSAVTNQIKALEDELQVELFKRNGRGVELTQSGKHLFSYSQKLLALRDEAKASVTGGAATPPLRIGGSDTVITYHLPKILKAYQKQQPQQRFSVHSMSSSRIKSDIMTGQLDLAFILEKPFQLSGLNVQKLQDEKILILAAATHRLAGKPGLKPEVLREENIFLTEAGCCYRNQFERVLIESGSYNADLINELVSIEAIKECVKLNLGIAALSKSSVAREVKNGELEVLQFAGVDISSSIHLVYKENFQQNEALRNFIVFCSDV